MLTEQDEERPSRWFSIGWFFVLVELYLAIAARALAFDVLIAPPALIFLAIDDWMVLTILIAIACGIEVGIRRNAASAIALVLALLVAATGPFRFER